MAAERELDGEQAFAEADRASTAGARRYLTTVRSKAAALAELLNSLDG